MRRAVAAALAAAGLAAGCGGGDAPGPAPPAPPEEPGSGYFVGTAAGGLGASVDLRASDRVVRAIEAALAESAPAGAVPRPSAGVASVVNGSSRPVRMPGFAAVLDTGGRAPLARAADLLRDRAGPAARRAAALLPPRRFTVAARASAVEYVVLEGAAPGGVAEVLMIGVEGGPVRLLRRPR